MAESTLTKDKLVPDRLARLPEALARSARRAGERYSGGADRPLAGYALTLTTYGALVGGITAVARAAGKKVPDGLTAGEVLMSAAATHKLSRLLAKDPVTSPLRAPFTRFEGTEGPAELSEQVTAQGQGKTVGELVTCPFCLSVWVATGMSAGLVLAPRVTRLVMGTFAALAGADVLQFAHAWLDKVSS